MNDGQIFVWGKNDRGQLGIGNSIGVDLVESESSPTPIDLEATLAPDERENFPLV